MYRNELVSDADIARHNLKPLRQRYACIDFGFQWTVTPDQASYLIEMRSNPQDPSVREFVFFWGGQLGGELLQLKTLSSSGQQRHLRWSRLATPATPASSAAAQQFQDRMAALKDALKVFRSDGIYSADAVMDTVDFDF